LHFEAAGFGGFGDFFGVAAPMASVICALNVAIGASNARALLPAGPGTWVQNRSGAGRAG
tara:strand:- start:1587 stop:1766 length:180 start_codon:yes stop_codon:yes gene_type:complete